MLNNKFLSILKQLVLEVLTFKYPTDKVLTNFFRDNKKLDAEERHIVAETVYGLLRNYYKITTIINKKNTLDLIGIVWLKILKLEPKLLKSITGINFAQLEQLHFKDDFLSITELPQWITDRLTKYNSLEDVIAMAQFLQTEAPLDLRVNILKTDVKSVFATLIAEKLDPQLMQFSPYGIRLTHKIFLAKHNLFTKGLIEVQDESSQIAGMLLNPKRGDMLVDFCAGSGGKTLILGMLMRGLGRIYALDVHEKRLNNLTPRLARSGLSNVYPRLIAHENDSKIKRLHGKIDRVFVDVPCTGFGTLRRNPELKFRQKENNLPEINAKQLSILTAASKLVKSGGHLVYATCSILQCENQDIVNKFLQDNLNFKLTPANLELNQPKLIDSDGYLVLLPHIHHTDGFFAALLQRID